MKRIVCEMCGNSDLVKENGVFVCQFCHSKYSVEEARKMMVEGTVEVQGTVKIDNKEMLGNYLNIAENAFESDNLTETEEYCNKILESDAENYQAWFLKGKAAGGLSTVDNLRFSEVARCLTRAMDKADEEFKVGIFPALEGIAIRTMNSITNKYLDYPICDNAKYYIQKVTEITGEVLNFAERYNVGDKQLFKNLVADILTGAAEQVWTTYIETYSNKYKPSMDEWAKFQDIAAGTIHIGESVEGLSNDSDKNLQRYVLLIKIAKAYKRSKGCWQNYIGGELKDHTEYVSPSTDSLLSQKIKGYEAEVLKINPEYKVSKVGGCYVATCVYGSYDCPQVWTLRRFRDFKLAKSWYGRAFINLYYAISPKMVKWFGKTAWFRNLLKPNLDKMVESLQLKGYSGDKYSD